MRFSLYGKHRLWFWIPCTIVSILFTVGLLLDIVNHPILALAGVAFTLGSIWATITVLKEPHFTEQDYWRMHSLQNQQQQVPDGIYDIGNYRNPPENHPGKSTPKITAAHQREKNDDGFGPIMTIVLITGLVVIGAMVISNQSLSNSIPQTKSRTATPVPPTKTTISNFASTYVNSGASFSCVLWSSITLADVGKTKCVYGTVRRTWFSEQQLTQYFTFSSDSQAIYFQKFMYVFDPGIDGRCIQFNGKIYRSYNTPYMDLLPNDAITFCD